jgi:hypothetical protein
MKKTTLIVIIVLLGLFVLIPVVFFIGMIFSFQKQTTPITDIREYPSVLSNWKKQAPETVTHFPDEIPLYATNVIFFYSPWFLQADAHIELYFKTDAEKIHSYYECFKQRSTGNFHGGYGWFRTYHELYPENIALSEDFEIMCFHADPNNTPEHYPKYGVAINEKNNIIIFWSEL